MSAFTDDEFATSRGPSFQRGGRGGADQAFAFAVAPAAAPAPQLPPAPAGQAASVASLPQHAQANAVESGGSHAAQRQAMMQMQASQRLAAELETAKAILRQRSDAAQAGAAAIQDRRPGYGGQVPASDGFVAGSAMASSVAAQRSRSGPVNPAAQAMSAQPQLPAIMKPAGTSPEDAWLAHVGCNADTWLDMSPGDRAGLIQRAGCSPSDVPVVVMSVDTMCLKRTQRSPTVNVAQGAALARYPNPYAVRPAGQVNMSTGSGALALGISLPWWLLILGGAGGAYWWYQKHHKGGK